MLGNAIDIDHLLPQIRALDEPFFKGLAQVCAIRSPGDGRLAVCGELHSRGWFGGTKVRYVGFLLKTGEKWKIIGQGVIGSRTDGEWEMEAEVDFS